MTPYTLETLRDALRARGLHATVEYPGFLMVPSPVQHEGSCVHFNIGDANGPIGVDVETTTGVVLDSWTLDSGPADPSAKIARELDRRFTVFRMIEELRAEFAARRVPNTVRAFVDVHDYIDANELGGFTSDRAGDFDAGVDADADFINECQGYVDTWLAARAARKKVVR
jgi:hypothetical protein